MSENDTGHDPRGAVLVRPNDENEWINPETGDRVVGDELGSVDDPDAYHLCWVCSRCGKEFVGEKADRDELVAAGWTSVHAPCSTEGELAEARDSEGRVVETINATPEF